jgi:xylulose-5-phosphate/fructose-6-phosphate phosphoketolase
VSKPGASRPGETCTSPSDPMGPGRIDPLRHDEVDEPVSGGDLRLLTVGHSTIALGDWGIWGFASNDEGVVPDVVMACCGDIPTLETLAAVQLLRQHLPELKVRVVNVVDLMRLESDTEHPHGLSDSEFDTIFTPDSPVVFAYHGYPTLIHRLTYRRRNHVNFHVRGYKKEGTTTTPFDMVMLNDLDRFHLIIDVVDRVPVLEPGTAALRQQMIDARLDARRYGREHGEDPPEIAQWRWDVGVGEQSGPIRSPNR